VYERRHRRSIADFGGLAVAMPVFATIFVFTALASIGLPGTSGFVGEFLTLIGTFQTHPWIALIGATGVIFAAYYMLPMVQRMWFNEPDKPENRNLPDLSRRELTVLLPLVVVMLWMGVYPKPFLERTEQTVVELLQDVERNRAPVQQRFGATGPAEVVVDGAVASERSTPGDVVADLTQDGRVEEEGPHGD
jgi:NADH-quinone oxidoreductase subunit M